MAERPIIFNAEMVRAILDGLKGQTRRVVKPQPDDRGPRWANRWEDWHGKKVNQPPQPGDLLWVRETWCGGQYGTPIQYKADWPQHEYGPLWKPSIHMPKWAARVWLKVKDVRVERVQDISREDAIKEGLLPHMREYLSAVSPITRFKDLWDSINKKRGFGWDENPWVWVIEFERKP